MQLQGSTALVTGGASGLGEGCVRRFVAHGANVVIVDRELASEVRTNLREVLSIAPQQADAEGVKRGDSRRPRRAGLGEQVPDALPHLLGCLIGEGDGKNAVR